MSVQAFSCYGDNRKKGFCVHCGGPIESRDHVPSKVLLDEPLPENVMVSPSCLSCNQSFSLDEQYLACLLECVIAGEVDPAKVERTRVARILQTNTRLSATLQKSRTINSEGQIEWLADVERVKIVLMKLARGHVAYELNQPCLGEPTSFAFKPLAAMSSNERDAFEDDVRDVGDSPFWPEVGSRAMQRIMIVGNMILDGGWLIIQDERYRFQAFASNGSSVVRIVIREYLACEVIWN
jgi:hypothetical protein